MQAGDLDQRIIIQRKQSVSDGGGGYTETWTDIATVWAKVEALSGRERVQAQQVEAPSMYRVTLRRRGDIGADDRIKWGSILLNIRWDGYVSGRHPYMTLDCEAGVAT